MAEIKRTVKLITQQAILENLKPAGEGFPMREWSIRVVLVDDKGHEHPANIFDKVTYKLHPTFQNPNRAVKKPPFKIEEQGWGEFDMEIVFHAADKGGDTIVKHDLHFQQPKYEALHTVTFTNPKPNLARLLAQSGPVPGVENLPEENGVSKKDKRKGNEDEGRANKKGRSSKVDMEKLAEGLQKLEEDDLLKVVQMVHEHKSADTYIKNDVEQGEFHVDLYTLPDHLLKMLWNFTTGKVEV